MVWGSAAEVSVSLLALVLCFASLLGNVLVIVPFARTSRVRTPSNLLILYLAVSDLVSGTFLSAIFVNSIFNETGPVASRYA